MTRELLDRLRRRAPHRQVRAERVAEDVDPAGARLHAGLLLRRLEEVADEEGGRQLAVVPEGHVVATQVAVLLERLEEGVGQGNDA